ncbi:Extracellular serine protease precursor [Pannonibacter phragmitetus]|uniref:Extracellular serine protease n=1 Tax=Pannonibacter phragmitetus TaxID=121719 RepID=A0A378ZZK8_9HYPH|nr:autotransporter domain-containing protein [Pannonibacter phragmitetus]SUB02538.1 Extracellular serine protease precursor [Pannonibacter phragmitetus]
MTAGDGSLTVDSESVASVIYASPQTAGTYNQTVNLTGTTSINRPDYSGLVMQFGTDSSTPPQYIPVTVNATVNIASGVTASSGAAGGFGTIWVKNDFAGNIAIDNAGTISLQAPNSDVAAISATSNLGAVTITNSGAVTSTGGRGIYADGNHNGTDPATISVTNTATGTVNATTAAIRVIAYNGLASIVNQGEVHSTLFQGLIAWSANGDATITNTGIVTSNTDNAVYATTENGTATITNSGTVTATGDSSLDADRAAIRAPAGYAGLIGSASTTGDIVITNEAAGVVTANRDAAIRAETPQGDITIVNAGTLSGQMGIYADSGQLSGHTNATADTVDGNISVTNSGTVTAQSIGVSLDGTTNRLENSGTITVTHPHGTGVVTGNGNTTIINSGTIAAASATDTAISMGSGTNRLVLTETSSITGIVSTSGTSSTLELTGTGAGTFDASQLSSTGQYQGFTDLAKSGSGTWTLTGSGGSVSGALAVNDGTLALGGAFTAGSVTVGSSTAATLSISGNGALTNGNGVIGGAGGGVGTVQLSGAAASWTSTGELTVGQNGGTGSISVSDGASFTSRRFALSTGSWEAGSGGNGSLTVSGAGTTWTNTGGVDIARTAGSSGSLTISGGASAFIRSTGVYTGAGAQILITGQNTRVEIGNPNDLSQAAWLSSAGGSVTVSDGAYLYASGIYAGSGGSDLVSMTITGAGTVVDAAERIYVGGQNGSRDVDPVNGNGNLTISGGAVVTTSTVGVGMDPKSQGVLTVTGQGTQLWAKANNTYSALGNFYVGYNGTAVVTVSDGAVIKADNEIRVGYDSQGSGKLIIGADAGSAAVAAGSVDTARIVFGTAGGSLVFNHTSQNYLMSQVISGNGSVNAAGGTTFLLGNNTYTGGTRIQGGTLRFVNDSALGAASGAVTFAGGTLSAADTVAVARNLVLESGSNTLDVASGKVLTVSGTISGAAGFTKSGTGTLVLTGTNSYGGGTRIQGGMLSFTSDAALGSAAGAIALEGGTLSAGETISTARGIALEGSQNALDVTGGKVLSLSGTISGAAGFTKSGTGTLVLTGTNTYSGVTTIADGTLQLGDGGTAGSIVGDVVNNATLIFNRSDNYTFSGSISGNGAVLFQGGGRVAFASPYQGAVTIDNSVVTLEQGVRSTSVFTIGNGGKLGGSGTIGGIVANSGAVVAPGYSPGTLVVTGAVSFLGGSVYQVDATPSGRHDLIIASGAVTIESAASVQVLGENGFYRPQTTYAIITSADAVNGTFGSVSSNFALLSPALTYDAKNVYLTLNYNGLTFADFARTDNQRSTARAVMGLPVGDTLYDALAVLSGSEIAPALDQLSGEAYASAGTVIQQQSSYLRDAVGARLRQGFAAHEALASAADAAGPRRSSMGGEHGVTIWAQGHGGWGRAFDGNNAATISSSLAGFLAGVDAGIGENARAGVVAGFSQSRFDVTSRNSSGDIDNYEVGVYGGARFGGVALKGGASYGLHDVSLDRSIAIRGFSASTQSGYRQEAAQVFGEASYGFSAGQVAIEPFAGLAFVHLAGASAQENGTPAALTVRLEDQNTFYTSLGMRAATQVNIMGRTFTPSVSLGWQHAFGDMAPVAAMRFGSSTSPFEVKGVPVARNTALIGLGLSHSFTDRASVQVNYKSQISSKAVENAFSAQMSLKF